MCELETLYFCDSDAESMAFSSSVIITPIVIQSALFFPKPIASTVLSQRFNLRRCKEAKKGYCSKNSNTLVWWNFINIIQLVKRSVTFWVQPLKVCSRSTSDFFLSPVTWLLCGYLRKSWDLQNSPIHKSRVSLIRPDPGMTYMPTDSDRHRPAKTDLDACGIGSYPGTRCWNRFTLF